MVIFQLAMFVWTVIPISSPFRGIAAPARSALTSEAEDLNESGDSPTRSENRKKIDAPKV